MHSTPRPKLLSPKPLPTSPTTSAQHRLHYSPQPSAPSTSKPTSHYNLPHQTPHLTTPTQHTTTPPYYSPPTTQNTQYSLLSRHTGTIPPHSYHLQLHYSNQDTPNSQQQATYKHYTHPGYLLDSSLDRVHQAYNTHTPQPPTTRRTTKHELLRILLQATSPPYYSHYSAPMQLLPPPTSTIPPTNSTTSHNLSSLLSSYSASTTTPHSAYDTPVVKASVGHVHAPTRTTQASYASLLQPPTSLYTLSNIPPHYATS